MRDPHVVSLTYRLETSNSVTFDAPPLEHETEAFSLRLEDDALSVEMREHFASVEEAREPVEHFLTSWEIYVSLTKGRNEVSFEYDDAEIVDREPPPGEPIEIQGQAASARAVAGKGSVQITRKRYPAPPKDFATSPEVEALLERYYRCLDGRERLLPMANFSCTVLKGVAGGKAKASKLFNISGSVHETLGELTARGDLRTARKWRDEKQNRPLSQSEENWLKQVVKRMILRLGEYNANPKGPFGKITMADFPQR